MGEIDHNFVSNKRLADRDNDVIISIDRGIDQLYEKSIDTTGRHVFIIDVHCTFKGVEKMQQQGGVSIYRNLLSIFNGNQDKLKVVFYSPIPKDDLVRLNPENYVLRLLPFVECKFEGGQFERDLSDQVAYNEENGWVQFNNASENLLSGWATVNRQKIVSGRWEEAKVNMNGKRALIIDDEWQQWKATYSAILSDEADYFLSKCLDIKNEFRKIDSEPFYQALKGDITSYDLVISDHYLYENHETDKWKTDEIIHSISGFKLFKMLRKLEPSIPVMFHTTSSKFRIFQTLSAMGADGQIPKNNNRNAQQSEKADTAQLFQEKLSEITADYSDCWLNEFYRYLTLTNGKGQQDWWKQSIVSRKKDLNECINMLLVALILYKQYRNSTRSYREALFLQSDINPGALFYSGIINELGRFSEEINKRSNPEIDLIKKWRNVSAHASQYYNVSNEICLILIILLYKTLKEVKCRSISNNQLNYPRYIDSGQDNDLRSKGYSGEVKRQHNEFIERLKRCGVNMNKVPGFNMAVPRTERMYYYSHPIYILLSYYNYQKEEFLDSSLKEMIQNELEILKDDFLNTKWNFYNRDEKRMIISEYPFFQTQNQGKNTIIRESNSNYILFIYDTSV